MDSPSPLPALPIQYADFAIWQRSWLKGEELERQLSYWRAQLANLPVTALPTDHPRDREPSFAGNFKPITVPSNVANALRQVGARERATLFMLLLASFYVLLFRYTDNDDLVIGSPIANRTHRDTADLTHFSFTT